MLSIGAEGKREVRGSYRGESRRLLARRAAADRYTGMVELYGVFLKGAGGQG